MLSWDLPIPANSPSSRGLPTRGSRPGDLAESGETAVDRAVPGVRCWLLAGGGSAAGRLPETFLVHDLG